MDKNAERVKACFELFYPDVGFCEFLYLHKIIVTGATLFAFMANSEDPKLWHRDTKLEILQLLHCFKKKGIRPTRNLIEIIGHRLQKSMLFEAQRLESTKFKPQRVNENDFFGLTFHAPLEASSPDILNDIVQLMAKGKEAQSYQFSEEQFFKTVPNKLIIDGLDHDDDCYFDGRNLFCPADSDQVFAPKVNLNIRMENNGTIVFNNGTIVFNPSIYNNLDQYIAGCKPEIFAQWKLENKILQRKKIEKMIFTIEEKVRIYLMLDKMRITVKKLDQILVCFDGHFANLAASLALVQANMDGN